MNEVTPEPKRCEVCGDPIRPDNKVGICSGRGKPECARARDRKRQADRPSRPRALRKPESKAPRADADQRYCEVCGSPLRCDNETGICGGRNRPECRKVRRSGLRAAVTQPQHGSYIKAGDVFGKWTALEDYSRDNRNVLVRCSCERGTEKRVNGKALVSGENRSCGCSRSGPRQGKPPYLTAGEVYTRLTVLEDVRRSVDRVRCLCECGNVTTPVAASVKNGITRSCRCLSRERQATQDGLSRHPLYAIWNSMIDRCTNPKVKAYHNYGGRGIKVCDRWLDLRLFIEDVEREIGPRPEGVGRSGRVLYSLDRKDNDRNYEPGNVSWATSSEQVMNQRKVVDLTRERDALAAELAALRASQPPA